MIVYVSLEGEEDTVEKQYLCDVQPKKDREGGERGKEEERKREEER